LIISKSNESNFYSPSIQTKIKKFSPGDAVPPISFHRDALIKYQLEKDFSIDYASSKTTIATNPNGELWQVGGEGQKWLYRISNESDKPSAIVYTISGVEYFDRDFRKWLLDAFRRNQISNDFDGLEVTKQRFFKMGSGFISSQRVVLLEPNEKYFGFFATSKAGIANIIIDTIYPVDNDYIVFLDDLGKNGFEDPGFDVEGFYSRFSNGVLRNYLYKFSPIKIQALNRYIHELNTKKEEDIFPVNVLTPESAIDKYFDSEIEWEVCNSTDYSVNVDIKFESFHRQKEKLAPRACNKYKTTINGLDFHSISDKIIVGFSNIYDFTLDDLYLRE
jgi:hypothetical protein